MRATIVIDGDRVILKSFDGRKDVRTVKFIVGNVQSLDSALTMIGQAAVAQDSNKLQRRARNVDS